MFLPEMQCNSSIKLWLCTDYLGQTHILIRTHGQVATVVADGREKKPDVKNSIPMFTTTCSNCQNKAQYKQIFSPFYDLPGLESGMEDVIVKALTALPLCGKFTFMDRPTKNTSSNLSHIIISSRTLAGVWLLLVGLFSSFLLVACESENNLNRTKSGLIDTSSMATGFIAKDCVNPDGEEGCAELIGEQVMQAGNLRDFVVEYTVGPSGINIGGGVSLGIHHGAEWHTQIHSDSEDGFVRLRSSPGDTLKVTQRNHSPLGMFDTTSPSLKSNAIFHNVLIVTADSRRLKPGEKLQFHFGAGSTKVSVPPYIDPLHEFRITTDSDGDGIFHAIAQSPVFEIRHAESNEFAALADSQVSVDKSFDVFVKMEDSYHNVVESWNGLVNIDDEHGRRVASNVAIARGVGQAQVRLSTSGPHRLRISDTEGILKGRSNPIRVYDELPEQRLYWSDLHGHTNVSDGLGVSADEYFRFGRDVSRLDVVALTDHGHFDWTANIKAVQEYHQPGEYVTILAQEAGAGSDHMNIYYRRDNTEHLSQWQTNYQRFLDWVKHQFNGNGHEHEIEAMVAPHHFAYDRGDPDYPFGAWDDEVARFIEVYSSHGTSEYPGNPRPLAHASSDPRKYMQNALDEGLRFGVIAASDNHDSHPGRSVWGRYPGGLAGIWASELTREAIWQALYHYQTYGTSLDRIYVEFSIDGDFMGSEIQTDQPVAISAYVIGKSDNVTVELLRNSQVIHTEKTSTGFIELDISDQADSGTAHYYLRVTQDNGERAWSSPIWVETDE